MKKLVITLAVLVTTIGISYGRVNRIAAAACITSKSIQAYGNYNKEMAKFRNQMQSQINTMLSNQKQSQINEMKNETIYIKPELGKIKIDKTEL